MFRLDSIFFNHATDRQVYEFTNHAFVYGPNTVGKTALTKALDFVLGNSEELKYQGLDNIDSIEALLTNDLTTLWIKRTILNKYYYRRTKNSDYAEISSETYKNNICLMLNNNSNNSFMKVYNKVFDERPTFRSFSFINYIDEKGLGDLSVVFTRAKDLKHQIRIRNIMDFFFNYENIEQIYEKEIRLEECQKELDELSNNYHEYQQNLQQLKKMFDELHLTYSDDYQKNYEIYLDFRSNFTRKEKFQSKDLIYLSKASFSLAEEIKLNTFMHTQSENMVERKDKITRLLTILGAIVEEEPDFNQYTSFITQTIKEIDEEKIILTLSDYKKAIKAIQEEKEKIDEQIRKIKWQANEISYEDAIKKIGVLEHVFTVLNKNLDVHQIKSLQDEAKYLKDEIKQLKSSFNKEKINTFNSRLTNLYLNSGLNVKHLEEDVNDHDYKLEFEPFKLCLFATHIVNDNVERFMPGSMARQTHLQILVYLSMFDYLKKNFTNFVYMPILIIDSANQPMGIESFKEVYPIIVSFADEIGLQTIFLSKDKIEEISDKDLIDISGGLNKFHDQQS
jgi:hypothetical protein